jgi:hypothetical protein
MSIKDFLETCKYKSEISEAVAYENKLAYFIQTHLNSDVYVNKTSTINNTWYSNNPFINWIKSWMRKENFDSYLKFLRNPLPTASLVQDDIVPELKKVFDATNAYYNYNFTSNGSKATSGELIKENAGYCKDVVFDALINNHNSIAITDFIESSKPYRYLINIDSVKCIEPTINGEIKRIVFTGVNQEGEKRWFYYTDEFYAVYIKSDENFTEESKNLHNIGACPADFISVEPLNVNKFVVRKSIFSNFAEKFENYVNYYTLQKMCLPHGAIPVITHYKKNNTVCETKFENGTQCVKGYISGQNGVIGDKDNLIPCPVCNSKTIIQAGTVIGLPVPKFGENGERPFDLNANFVKFHYIPVDILKWWDEFVDKKASEIKFQLVGKGLEDSNGQAKNKDQIARGNQTLENTLIELSAKLSKLQKSLDSKMLKIAFGDSFISCFIDKGTDFYLETEFELRDSLTKAIDPIDKENIISRINYSLYKNNPQRLLRNSFMYKLLPYSTITDSEFNSMSGVDPEMRELRLNFPYYIDLFEGQYGDLDIFLNNYFGENVTDSNKLEMARKLLIEKVETPETVQEE